MLAFLAARAIPGVEVRRAAIATGARIDARRLPRHASRSRRCRAATRSPRRSASPSVRALPAIVARIRRLFDLGADVARDRRAARRGSAPRARSSRRARGCACRAPGTASSSRCAPCSASRSRWRRRGGSPASSSRRTASRSRRRPRRRARRTSSRAPSASPRPTSRARHAARARRGARARSPRRRSPIRGSSTRDGDLDATVARLRALPGHRRVDRAVHRDARAARAGRLPGRRRRPAARDGRPRPARARRRPRCSRAPSAGGPWRAYAAQHLWSAGARSPHGAPAPTRGEAA